MAVQRKRVVHRVREERYVYESIAHNLYSDDEIDYAKQRNRSNVARRNREKAGFMNIGYMSFLCVAMVVAAIVLTNYLGLQSELTNMSKDISQKEVELYNLKAENDEDYNRVMSSIDLEEVRRIAISELGMRYPEEGQIIYYDGKLYDYMRRVGGFSGE